MIKYFRKWLGNTKFYKDIPIESMFTIPFYQLPEWVIDVNYSNERTAERIEYVVKQHNAIYCTKQFRYCIGSKGNKKLRIGYVFVEVSDNPFNKK